MDPICLATRNEMRGLLAGRLPTAEVASVTAHLDSCTPCWAVWNELRWNTAKGRPELCELRAFLGEDFTYGVDSSWKLAEEWSTRERKTRGHVEEFYRTTRWYIYNQVVFAACGQRPDYVGAALPYLRAIDADSICDLGSGVGTDALRLCDAGVRVACIEVNDLCREFLQWRIRRRHLSPRQIEVRHDGAGHGCDVLWLMDVVEHLPDPVAVLAPLLGDEVCAALVDTHSDSIAGGRQPFHYRHPPHLIDGMFKARGFHPAAVGRVHVWQREGISPNA